MKRVIRNSRRLSAFFSGLILVAIALVAAPRATAANEEPGFKSLFNGKDLSGWDGNPKFWSVRDGAITGETTEANKTPGNTFLIWRDGTVEDFERRLPYRIVKGNAGIQYRSKAARNEVVGRA